MRGVSSSVKATMDHGKTQDRELGKEPENGNLAMAVTLLISVFPLGRESTHVLHISQAPKPCQGRYECHFQAGVSSGLSRARAGKGFPLKIITQLAVFTSTDTSGLTRDAQSRRALWSNCSIHWRVAPAP